MKLPTIEENREYKNDTTYESKLNNIRYKNILLTCIFEIADERNIYIDVNSFNINQYEPTSPPPNHKYDENLKQEKTIIDKIKSKIKKLF